jgi:hypothetical protein
MSDIVFYNSYNIFLNPKNYDKLKNVPGGEAFSLYFKIFSQNITAIDRTDTVSIPLKTSTLDLFKLPKFEKYEKDFEEICNDRAKFLINKAKETNRKMLVMYSGGVDSTLILVSLLKNATKEELKNIIVMLSDSSIKENSNFYYNHVIKNFECVSSYRFPYFLGNDNYFTVSGENADQLFGSQVNDFYTKHRPYSDLFKPIEEVQGNIIDWFNMRVDESERKYTEGIFLLFKKIVDNAPIKLNDTYKFFWWINFVTKWQSVYVRILPYSVNKSTIKFEENYTTFYSPKEFQLWSMNNVDKFVKDTPNSTKYIPKSIICDFTKDNEYHKKPKMGSLALIVKQKEMIYTLNEDMTFTNKYPDKELYNYNNDFSKI